MKTKKILAENLKAYREFYDMSQREVAKRAGMSYRGYGKLERQEVSASLDTLDKLSVGLGIPTSLLLSSQMIRCLPFVN